MTGESVGGASQPAQQEPDAYARGWIEPAVGTRDTALFVLAGSSLGVTDLQVDGPQGWYDLRAATDLDAVGEPVEGIQEVDLAMADGRRVRAGWTEDFCSSVVQALMSTLPDATPAAPPVAPAPATPAGSPVAPAPDPAPATPAAAASAPHAPGEPVVAPAPEQGGAVLVLEDVTYLSGHPDQPRKRRRCSATLTREAIEVSGPKGLTIQVAWSVVQTLEAQNADEARFRMNARIHRDATALVLECDDGTTLLLEARDCPTIALRGAIAQLVDDLPVVVV